MSPNRSPEAVAKRILREAKQLSNDVKPSGGIRKKKGGRAEARTGEPDFMVPRLAAPLPLSQDTVPAKNALLATEARAVVPATHALLAAARVSCISVECVAASCAISYAEEMELADAPWPLYF